MPPSTSFAITHPPNQPTNPQNPLSPCTICNLPSQQQKQAFLADPSSAGNAVPTRFLADYMTYVPAAEPEAFTACPVLLTQPAEDRWTPQELRWVRW
jgi:alpha-beta hydrolase superfamily lysophospholipase